MSEKSIIGSMPCACRFSASVAMSTFPVRSPLPKRQPSTRCAPASTASSAHAIPVPRSLCGCTERITASLRARLVCMYSIWSAYTFGVAISTVAGRLRITGRSVVASHSAVMVSQRSSK